MDDKKKIAIKYSFAIFLIVSGIVLNMINIGRDNFSYSFGSVGNWMIYIGLVTLLIIVLQSLKKTKKKADERAYYISAKANRIVFLAVIIFAFIIMIIDGIAKITLDYHIFMSYLVCGMLCVYFIAYKVIEKYN